MKSIDELKDAYQREKALQTEHGANPETPAARRNARITGLVLFVFGLVASGFVYFLFTFKGLFSSTATGLAVVLLGFGLLLIVSGKLPKKK